MRCSAGDEKKGKFRFVELNFTIWTLATTSSIAELRTMSTLNTGAGGKSLDRNVGRRDGQGRGLKPGTLIFQDGLKFVACSKYLTGDAQSVHYEVVTQRSITA